MRCRGNGKGNAGKRGEGGEELSRADRRAPGAGPIISKKSSGHRHQKKKETKKSPIRARYKKLL